MIRNVKGKQDAIRLLNVVTSVDLGGVSTLLLGYYKNMDMSGLCIDIVAIDKGCEQMFACEFEALGCNVYYMPKNYIKRLFFFIRLLHVRKYAIIHSHMDIASAGYLAIAKLMGVRKRIAHAHMAFWNKNRWYHNLLRKILNSACTDRWGCSKDAIYDLFKEKANVKPYLLKNAIDLSDFTFNKDIRNEYRREFGIDNKYVLGFVGRLSYQKDPLFVLDILADVLKKRNDAVLLVCGTGEMETDFIEYAQEKGVVDHVILLGQRKDVNKIMMAMDCLLVPSLWEGLGIVLIEAQAVSLQCVASDEGIPKETDITPYVDYISRRQPSSVWAEHVLNIAFSLLRKEMVDEITEKGYNIAVQGPRLRDKYIE